MSIDAGVNMKYECECTRCDTGWAGCIYGGWNWGMEYSYLPCNLIEEHVPSSA